MSSEVLPRVVFEEKFKTFKLFPGVDSLYAFSISPELTLEHLYWGKRLQDDFDLRYLSQSSRVAHFSIAEKSKVKKLFSDVVTATSFMELKDTWKNSSSNKNRGDFVNELQQLRIKNLSWRMMIKFLWSSKELAFQKLANEFIACCNTENPEKDCSFNMREGCYKGDIAWNCDTDISPTKATMGITEPPFLYNRIVSSKTHVSSKTCCMKSFNRLSGILGKGLLNTEYSDYGTGDFRSPSFSIVDKSTGSSITPIRYKNHEIIRGKVPTADSFPSIRCPNESDATTLIITMSDDISGIEVDLIYG